MLDFASVQLTTQSYVHALVAEAFQYYGEDAVNRIEFRKCVPQVEQAIRTVAAYSLRARALARSSVSDVGSIESALVPQANDLEKVRRVVDIVADGPIPIDAIAEASGYSSRHVRYRANAAEALGLLSHVGTFSFSTQRGLALAATKIGSAAEFDQLRDAVASSAVLNRLAPGLLRTKPPPFGPLVNRIVCLTGLSASTAERRAGCLLSWRRQLKSRQLTLPQPTVRRGHRA